MGTAQNSDEVEPLRTLLAGMGIVGRDFAVRPLVARGFSTQGAVIEDTNTVPEVAVTADGVHWHPAGADLDTSPDMLLAWHPSVARTGHLGPSWLCVLETRRRDLSEPGSSALRRPG